LAIDLRVGLFPFSMFWAILNMMILDLYNLRLKQSGLFGNMIVGYVTAALFIYADIVVNKSLTVGSSSIGLYAFFLIWGREVWKDVIDIEGDRAHDIKTIPVRFGKTGGMIVGSLIIFLGLLSTLPLIFLPIFGSLFIPIILSVLDLTIIGIILWLGTEPSNEMIYRGKLWLLRMLLLALLVLAGNQFIVIYL
ncbi:MAG: UbiA family prenyltransferase, partial [Candidatus Kariarchaeaceae archaeon]